MRRRQRATRKLPRPREKRRKGQCRCCFRNFQFVFKNLRSIFREEAQREYEEQKRKEFQKKEYQREKKRDEIRKKYGIEKKGGTTIPDKDTIEELKADMTEEEYKAFQAKINADQAEKQVRSISYQKNSDYR